MAPWRHSDSYSVFDVFQTRILLEGEIARLAAGRLTQLQLDKMEQASRAMEECWANQELLANVEADLEFHGTIVSACSNDMLKALYQTVHDQVKDAAPADPDHRPGMYAGIDRRAPQDHRGAQGQ